MGNSLLCYQLCFLGQSCYAIRSFTPLLYKGNPLQSYTRAQMSRTALLKQRVYTRLSVQLCV